MNAGPRGRVGDVMSIAVGGRPLLSFFGLGALFFCLLVLLLFTLFGWWRWPGRLFLCGLFWLVSELAGPFCLSGGELQADDDPRASVLFLPGWLVSVALLAYPVFAWWHLIGVGALALASGWVFVLYQWFVGGLRGRQAKALAEAAELVTHAQAAQQPGRLRQLLSDAVLLTSEGLYSPAACAHNRRVIELVRKHAADVLASWIEECDALHRRFVDGEGRRWISNVYSPSTRALRDRLAAAAKKLT
jgi:hypothetical protein